MEHKSHQWANDRDSFQLWVVDIYVFVSSLLTVLVAVTFLFCIEFYKVTLALCITIILRFIRLLKRAA